MEGFAREMQSEASYRISGRTGRAGKWDSDGGEKRYKPDVMKTANMMITHALGYSLL